METRERFYFSETILTSLEKVCHQPTEKARVRAFKHRNKVTIGCNGSIFYLYKNNKLVKIASLENDDFPELEKDLHQRLVQQTNDESA